MDQTIANEVHEMIVSTIIHDIPSETSVEQTYPFYIYIHRMLGEQITRECRSNSHTFYREKFPDSPDANLLPLFRKKKKEERIDGKYVEKTNETGGREIETNKYFRINHGIKFKKRGKERWLEIPLVTRGPNLGCCSSFLLRLSGSPIERWQIVAF